MLLYDSSDFHVLLFHPFNSWLHFSEQSFKFMHSLLLIGECIFVHLQPIFPNHLVLCKLLFEFELQLHQSLCKLLFQFGLNIINLWLTSEATLSCGCDWSWIRSHMIWWATLFETWWSQGCYKIKFFRCCASILTSVDIAFGCGLWNLRFLCWFLKLFLSCRFFSIQCIVISLKVICDRAWTWLY